MGRSAVKVGVVDIGTNSARLLITDGVTEDGRWTEVTGLGVGVDATGELNGLAIVRTLAALDGFFSRMESARVDHRLAIATSACRDAGNREDFFDQVESALGVRPSLVTGAEEARLALRGAVGVAGGNAVVSDIGGGSTELVTEQALASVDIGSVRLTDRFLPDRPPRRGQMEMATLHLGELFAGVEISGFDHHIGVAGTWTSLGAIAQDLSGHHPGALHGYTVTNQALHEIVEWLSRLTIEETSGIPNLDPGRAPVILSGALVALAVVEVLGVETTRISERDSLDALAAELLALA